MKRLVLKFSKCFINLMLLLLVSSNVLANDLPTAEITKDAEAFFTRTWNWTINKSADQADLTLSLGQQFLVNYEVRIDTIPFDSDFNVRGVITIFNNGVDDFLLEDLSDVVSPDIPATFDCGAIFPTLLPAGASISCDYSADLPDGALRTNTATVMVSDYAGNVGEFSASAEVDFSFAAITEIDQCVDINDTNIGPIGNFCADSAPIVVQYGLLVGPYEICGDYTVENTVFALALDSGTEVSDTWTVTVNVPCEVGCTLTSGYWKTHSEYGPAPYDDTWAQLSDGADTSFFLSGQTYNEVLWTQSSGGNAYYILAHQYIAATLNVLNGADPSDVQAFLDAATDLFNTYTPEEIAAAKGRNGRVLREQFTSIATLLENYNSGVTGPGHCSEEDNQPQ